MFLLFVFYIVAEIYAMAKFVEAYGFVNLLFVLFMGAILGIGVLRTQSQYLLRKVQEAASKGQEPSDQLVRGMAAFLAGILLISPGLISDVVALLLLFPPTRYLIVMAAKRRFARQFSAGQNGWAQNGWTGSSASFRVFTFGADGMARVQQDDEPDFGMRDVSPKVIDVTPIKKSASSASQSETNEE
jgi:UPF0716 protein FxsA